MSEMVKQLGELLQEAGAVVYYSPTNHTECQSVIGRWAYKARDLQAEIDDLRRHLYAARAVLRDNRAPDGKWYIDAGTLVERLEAALKDAP